MTNWEKARGDTAFSHLMRMVLDPTTGMNPGVMLHLVGLVGALLRYHGVSLEDIVAQVEHSTSDPATSQKLDRMLSYMEATNEEGRPTH